MKNAILMPVLGLLILIATFRWWFRVLMAPKTLGRWLLATLYMVFVGALWFIGIAFDMGKPPSVAGMAFIFAVLIGLWVFTGLPMAIFGTFDSIESHRVRRSYAQKLNSSEPEVLEFEDTAFRIDSAKNIQAAGRTIESKALWFAATRKILQSVLQTIADPSPEILKRLKVIYFFDGRMELELDFLDTESKLDEWVKCVKRLAGWSPPPHLLDEILY